MAHQKLAELASETPYKNKYTRLGVGRTRGELRLDILNATSRALRGGSYETLTMEQVATQASISRRTLYNLFFDKDDIYKSSREHLIKTAAALVAEEIPERMSPLDGLRFFIQSCVDVYGNPASTDLIISIVRDGTHQPWLVQQYEREIHDRLVRACENFVLKQCRRFPLAPGVPRHIGEQLVGIVKSLTLGPAIFCNSKQKDPPTDKQLELLAFAYSSLMTPRPIGG